MYVLCRAEELNSVNVVDFHPDFTVTSGRAMAYDAAKELAQKADLQAGELFGLGWNYGDSAATKVVRGMRLFRVTGRGVCDKCGATDGSMRVEAIGLSSLRKAEPAGGSRF